MPSLLPSAMTCADHEISICFYRLYVLVSSLPRVIDAIPALLTVHIG